ncbi:MAG: DUF1634 domain-containing protein [Acidobacteriaceae bacterium]
MTPDAVNTLPKTDDNVLDRRIGILLRSGVLISAAVTLLGGVLFLVRHGSVVPQYHIFHGQPKDLRSLTGIITGALHGHALAIIQLGLLLLIATPVARVVFSVIEFALERDYLYVVISGIVLVVLLYSLIFHGAH